MCLPLPSWISLGKTCVFRAWGDNTYGHAEKPAFLCPAMNPHMWHHPLTKCHLDNIKQRHRYAMVLGPIEKKLACGDTGLGALCELAEIVGEVTLYLGFPSFPKTYYKEM